MVNNFQEYVKQLADALLGDKNEDCKIRAITLRLAAAERPTMTVEYFVESVNPNELELAVKNFELRPIENDTGTTS